jgi:hypothetical protein
MKRQGKVSKPRSLRHIAARAKGIATTTIRLGIDMLVIPRRDVLWRWECPTISEVIGRIGGRRAVQIRDYATGRRRPPAWFVAVLVGELERQVEQRREIIEKLKAIDTSDHRRGPEASRRGRIAMLKRLNRPIPGEGER